MNTTMLKFTSNNILSSYYFDTILAFSTLLHVYTHTISSTQRIRFNKNIFPLAFEINLNEITDVARIISNKVSFVLRK